MGPRYVLTGSSPLLLSARTPRLSLKMEAKQLHRRCVLV
jgi:hypothetical protein